MQAYNVKQKQSVMCFLGGKRVACVARDDVPIVLKPRVNIPIKDKPVSLRVMFDAIVQAKGEYDDL